MHNKSLKSSLSVLDFSDEALKTYTKILKTKLEIKSGHIFNSPCLITNSKDGRFSHEQKKICFGYQLVAWEVFGRTQLESVPSNKNSHEAVVISHVCGNGPRCCRKEHLKLEPKWVNDERTHCHFAINHAFNTGGYDAVTKVLELGICPHTPKCCTIS